MGDKTRYPGTNVLFGHAGTQSPGYTPCRSGPVDSLRGRNNEWRVLSAAELAVGALTACAANYKPCVDLTTYDPVHLSVCLFFVTVASPALTG